MHIPEPTSNYAAYRQAVQRAIQQPPWEWTFKSDAGYREVLEHVMPAQGAALLAWSLAAQPDLKSKWIQWIQRLAARNDSVGAPIKASYLDGMYSPSNWRYLCHAIKLWQHIESLNLPEADIVELGGGYGGLALWVDGLRHLFMTRLRLYSIVDLPEVAQLQNMVANELNLPITVYNGLPADSDRIRLLADVPQVFMSAYAFSEFDQQTRDWYAEHLVRHCDHGLIVWNFPERQILTDGRRYGGPVYPFIDKPLTIRPDAPDLYAGHQVVTW